MKEKFREGFKSKIQPRYDHESGEFSVNPFRDAQFALAKKDFTSKERNEFFDGVYVDILSDMFMQWLKSEPHCTKEREYLYACAMALGSVKHQMIQYETYGRNASNILAAKKETSDEQTQD